MSTLDLQREMTRRFIEDDPTTVSLIPRIQVTTPGGGKSYADGTPRAPQTFKLSLLGHDQRPLATVSGRERRIEYHLIGEHNAEMAIGDYWLDSDGTRYEIIGFTEGFDYMRKALVYRHLPPDSVVK